MAFNKARVLQEAESLANQGKISQAIGRYFSILERDPSELILLNTIGDLYIRDRNVSEGLKQFYRLAEAYVQGGYTLKAIAIYKKIAKLEPDSVDPLLKLVELYQAQRLVREARELYYLVAECYKKKKQNDKVLETLRKAVQLDAENPAARTRLVAFCEEIGRKGEAAQVYMEIAQLALRRGDTGAAQTTLKKAQELAPDDPQIPLLLARQAMLLKHPEDVEAILSGTPGLMKDPAGRSLLIDSYLAMQQPEKAETLVLDAVRATPADFSPLASFVSVCVQVGQLDTASNALSVVADELVAHGNTSSLMESLSLIRSKSPLHLPTLELILRICEAGGDKDAPQEILEALGHAHLQCGEFKKAEQSFQRLVDREPLNEHYRDLLGQALQAQSEEFGNARDADLPSSAAALTQEEEAAFPPASPLRAGDREGLVREALENSELFARYHLVSKAVAELERVLEVYPEETEIHKRLVSMCWKDMPERAEQAAQALARIYAQQGDAEGAKRFAQIAGGGEAAAAIGVPLQSLRTPAVQPEPLPPHPPQPAGISAGETDLAPESSLAPAQEAQGISSNLSIPPAPQGLPPTLFESPRDPAMLAPSAIRTGASSEMQEIDLSEEWESFLAQRGTSSLSPHAPQKALSFNYDDSRVEINFYLEQGFLEEANGAVRELERMLPGDPRIADLRALVESHTGAPAREVPEKEPAKALEITPGELVAPPGEEVEGREFSSSNAAPEPEEKRAAGLRIPLREERPPTDATPGWGVASSTGQLGDFAEGFESEWGKLDGPSRLPASLSAPKAGPAPGIEEEIPTEAAPRGSVGPSANLLGDFSEAFESAMGGLEGISSSPKPSSAPTVPVIPSQQSRDSNEIVPEPNPEDDPEDHYNLGVAFWEMNLPDEAIRELQQVVKGAGTRPDAPNYLQACTLLAACFMEKGMASVAAKWYGRALEAPHLDEEASLAIHYDLGAAYERAGDLPRALEEFSEVYSRNIAFRDVAEKVRLCQQKGSSR